ncbi:hypothetical protein [Massilia sp. Mn16-1_5]|uniref:hypothetical protein n=1 Tax=Massilia sp. Mn16-1_5 TaxID=2079199 RepID=UPI00109ECD3D|nr:hypothetical protein [Massilia sp. Mn16-1_5]
MIAKRIRPMYSPPWLGRPFTLTEDSLAWGRYVITDSTMTEASKSKRRYLESVIRQTDPVLLASTFEHLLHVYCPSNFPDFLREIQALATYYYAKEHLKALLRDGCAPDDYFRARIATVGAFDEALAAVFESSIPLHGLSDLTYVLYRQKLHGMHLTSFTDDQHTYEAAFTSDLVLDSIHLESDWSRIWPQST